MARVAGISVPQSTAIFGALTLGFVIYTASKGTLVQYLKALWGKTPTNNNSFTSAQSYQELLNPPSSGLSSSGPGSIFSPQNNQSVWPQLPSTLSPSNNTNNPLYLPGLGPQQVY